MNYYDYLLMGFPASRLSHSNLFLIFLNIKLIMSPSCLANFPLIPHYLQTLIQLPLPSLRELSPSGSKSQLQSHLLLFFPQPTSHAGHFPVMVNLLFFFYFCRGEHSSYGNLSSLTSYQTRAPCSGTVES